MNKMVVKKSPMVLLVIDKTGKQMKKFLKRFSEMDDVVLMPDINGNNAKWHFIRKAMNERKKIIMYAIYGKGKKSVEDAISSISYHFRYQNVNNIIRVVLDDNLI